MATVTWNVSKDSRIAYRNSDGWEAGSGTSDGLPVGLYSGYKYRTLLGFSYSFSGMTSITSAVLHIKTSSQIHVAFGSDPDIEIRRLTSSFSEGSANALSSSNAVTWANQPSASGTNLVDKDVTTSESTFITATITGIIQDAFAAGVFYGLRLSANNEAAEADTTEFFSSEFGSSHDAYIEVTYETNTAPNAPFSLTPTGNQVVNTLTPTFAGSFSDPDVGDALSGVQILLYNSAETVLLWDSGTVAASGQTFSKVYSGSALTGDTAYHWKARTKDLAGVWGPYSAFMPFIANSVPNAPTISLTQTPTSDIKTLTPTFNMTHSDPDASDSQMLGYRIILETSGGSAVWDSGDVTVTATVSKAVTYAGPALSWQTGYRWRARTKDSNDAWGAYSTNATFTTHTTGVPISLSPVGAASSTTPTFSGARATSADSLTHAQIEVYASNGTTLIWDSTSTTSGVTSSGFSRAYGGTTLTAGTTYKWRARVTSSIGGVSAWSALQTITTPDATTPDGTAPVGSNVTPVTNLNFTFTRGTNFNRHQLYLYDDAGGTSQVTSDTPTTYGATGSKTFVYSGTLAWNTTYWWKVRVSADGGSNWSAFTGLIQFTTDAAGQPTLDTPINEAWLGAPLVVDEYDDITGVTNGTSASTSLETGSGLFQTGIGALKVAIAGLSASGTSYTYRTLGATLDLSGLGPLTPLYIYSRYSSSTNVSTLRLRIEFNTASDYAEFDIKPSATNAWEQKSFTKGSPTATGGTVNWALVKAIGVRLVATGGGSVTSNVYVDDLKFDSTAPAFSGTTFASEVISTFRIRVYAADQTTLIWDSGDTAGSSTTFSKLYAGTALTKGLTYYWQARYVKSTGPTGDYSQLQPFIVNSDPSVPTGLSPASGSAIGTTTPHFIATFNDTEKGGLGDVPTYMEVEVYRNSDSVLAYQLITKTGLISSNNEIYDGLSGTVKVTGAAAPIVDETEYKYRVRYYDSKGARGSWTSYTTFKPTQPPVATILSPSDAGTVTSPSFSVTWSMSSPGGKSQNAYEVKVIRTSDAVTVIDTGQVFSSATSYVVPGGFLTNGNEYRIELTLWDTDVVASAVDTATVDANWAAPDAIQDFTVTDDVSLSSNTLHWTVSNMDPADFRRYVIYRKFASDTEWTALVELTNQSQVLYRDYIAANTVSYEYKINQFQIVPGDIDLESSDSDIGSAMLDTDSWFVIGADRAEEHIFEIPVTSGPFIEPVQQEVFEALGTNRKVIVRGKVMGAEGTIMGKWSTSERDAAIAQIEYIKSTAGPHILKSPFGDVWNVEFSGPNKEYIHGGHFNATIVWTEVA